VPALSASRSASDRRPSHSSAIASIRTAQDRDCTHHPWQNANRQLCHQLSPVTSSVVTRRKYTAFNLYAKILVSSPVMQMAGLSTGSSRPSVR
jgi:hypothetical protein